MVMDFSTLLPESQLLLVFVVACASVFTTTGIVLLILYKKLAVRKRNVEFGTIKSTDNVSPLFTLDLLQPTTELDTDPATDAHGLTYSAYQTLLTGSSRVSKIRKSFSGSADEERNWQLSFKLWYKPEKKQLCVNVRDAKCLTTEGSLEPPFVNRQSSSSSIYVQLSHSMEESKVFCTNLYSNVGRASIDETFKFSVPNENIEEGTLELVLVETEQFDRTRLYQGRVRIEMRSVQLMGGQVVEFSDRELEVLAKSKRCTGEVLVSLRYCREVQRLTLKLLCVRDVCVDIDCIREYYLRTTVVLGNRRLYEAQGTKSISLKKALLCGYNFEIPPEAIESCFVTFALAAVVGEGADEVEKTLAEFSVGRVGFCSKSATGAREQWRQMLKSGKSVQAWHRFRSTIVD